MKMGDLAIRVENLGKLYRIGQYDQHKTLREVLYDVAKLPIKFIHSLLKDNSQAPKGAETIWALRNVSFEVKHGEIIGIIGRNGSGKSTLLKILSQITEPTEGKVEGYGRVGSLLEVGTGFHGELTGRENIYLNGSILGMNKAEIARKFDEIVAFADVAKFLETPVKHYSSGMFVRLAFAVAAHLEPEILIIDEVLAVGDFTFQRKCLRKMDEISRTGCTILFVSHNMGLIQSLCQRVIVLRNGSLVADDTTSNAIDAYLQQIEASETKDLLDRSDRAGKGKVRLIRIDIMNGNNSTAGKLITGCSARFVFHVTAVISGISCSFTVYDQYGQPITYFDSAVHGCHDEMDQSLGQAFSCEIDELLLIPGRYRINAALMLDGELQDHIEGASNFEVEQGTLRGRTVPQSSGYGSIITPHHWKVPA